MSKGTKNELLPQGKGDYSPAEWAISSGSDLDYRLSTLQLSTKTQTVSFLLTLKSASFSGFLDQCVNSNTPPVCIRVE